MDEYTPTTEDVRVMYASDEYGVEHEDDVAAFYRWLERVRREAGAGALREAATEVYRFGDATAVNAAKWIRSRADRLDGGE